MLTAAENEVAYLIDANDRLIDISASFIEFYRANGGSSPSAHLGENLLAQVQGLEVRSIYMSLLKKVRRDGNSLRFMFRCDSPSLRRLMGMEVAPGERGQILFRSRLLHAFEKTRETSILFKSSLPLSEVLRFCAWCNRLNAAGEWIEIEQALQRLQLMAQAKLPPVTHGVCPRCLSQLREEFGPFSSASLQAVKSSSEARAVIDQICP